MKEKHEAGDEKKNKQTISADWNSSNSLSIGEKPSHVGRLLVGERIPAVDVNEPRLASRLKPHDMHDTLARSVFSPED